MFMAYKFRSASDFMKCSGALCSALSVCRLARLKSLQVWRAAVDGMPSGDGYGDDSQDNDVEPAEVWDDLIQAAKKRLES